MKKGTSCAITFSIHDNMKYSFFQYIVMHVTYYIGVGVYAHVAVTPIASMQTVANTSNLRDHAYKSYNFYVTRPAPASCDMLHVGITRPALSSRNTPGAGQGSRSSLKQELSRAQRLGGALQPHTASLRGVLHSVPPDTLVVHSELTGVDWTGGGD